ncbi:MAG: methionine aminopeptidase type, partial [Microbacteriaceae bacterium]|nr:methionine aminopeptidase type [Microbacteriaceae bacterium]
AFVAETLTALKKAAVVGVSLLKLDAIAADLIRRAGATSCYVDYHPSFGAMPFGKVLCTSVNDAALHGLPFDYRLQEGDLVSLDFAASVNGWVADSAVSIIVGTDSDPERQVAGQHLIDTTELALAAAIQASQPGARMGDVSAAIGDVCHAAGYGVNTDFGGHGVGHTMHGDPHVANDGRPGRGLPLRAGLVFAIEPWLMIGTDRVFTDPDGWTLRSLDGSRAAHSEHTIAITEDGPIVLTQRA